MDKFKVEKIGGLAGFGLPGSPLTSSGEVSRSALSATEQASVEALFQNPPRDGGRQRDMFRYRITRMVKGQTQTVEVPETAVPQALKACVFDRLQ